MLDDHTSWSRVAESILREQRRAEKAIREMKLYRSRGPFMSPAATLRDSQERGRAINNANRKTRARVREEQE